jgi:hypothetical protein
MTPLKAIREVCVACAGGPAEVKDCGGDECLCSHGDQKEACFFYPYRMGEGRPSVKLIRQFCIECMGDSKRLVAECQSEDCPLYEYRFGTNPRRAGMGNKKAIPPTVSSEKRCQNSISAAA